MAITYTSATNLLNYIQGTVTATDEAITLNRFLTWGFVAFQITGTWTGTITFEGTVDGATWVTISVTPSNSSTTATSATANGVWWIENTGYQGFRARFSTASSGTPKITIKGLQSQY